jgi:hypothetical protein
LSEQLEGACLCGSVTYSSSGPALATINCHCRDCQKQTGSAFSTMVAVPADRFEVTGETLSSFTTIGTDTGEEAVRHFCRGCGSPLFTRAAVAPGLVFIKAGTLTDPSGLQPVADAWCDSAQTWVSLPEERLRMPRGPSAKQLAALGPA